MLSAVFLPLAFVVGFFGQNFDDLPGASHWTQSDVLMHIMVALCALTPIVMVGVVPLSRLDLSPLPGWRLTSGSG